RAPPLAHTADPAPPPLAPNLLLHTHPPAIQRNHACITIINPHHPTTCLMNPTAVPDADWGEGTLRPAPVQRRVLVVGGGPAGLEAARTAALRGHAVTIWEREAEVGGQVNIAGLIRSRSEFTYARTYFGGEG